MTHVLQEMDYPWITLKSSFFWGGSSGGDPAVHWDGPKENLDETSELRHIPHDWLVVSKMFDFP